MLTRDANELLTQTGPGTPMGDLFRRFWQPVLLANELPEPDCPPVRIKALSEQLVAFRDTNGDVGVIDNFCPHRRASLFFGRNEECGLRCVYHGWKYDVNGECVDMPSEPTESNFKEKVKIKSYPARQWGGCIWIYMGPAELMPGLPQFEWCMVPDSHRNVRRWIQESNYMQATEGEIDTSHVSFNHRWFDLSKAPRQNIGRRLKNGAALTNLDGAPQLTVKETEYGFIYGSRRRVGDDEYYWRVTQFVLPFYSFIPNPSEREGGRCWVPMDDTHISVFQYSVSTGEAYTEEQRAMMNISPENLQRVVYRFEDGSYVDAWQPQRQMHNDFLIDRDMQRTINYTGIGSGREQDMAMTDSMGSVADRTREHLGTSDTAIIAGRRILLRLARELQEGVEPYAPSHPEVFGVRAIDVVDSQADFFKLLQEKGELGKSKATMPA